MVIPPRRLFHKLHSQGGMVNGGKTEEETCSFFVCLLAMGRGERVCPFLFWSHNLASFLLHCTKPFSHFYLFSHWFPDLPLRTQTSKGTRHPHFPSISKMKSRGKNLASSWGRGKETSQYMKVECGKCWCKSFLPSSYKCLKNVA